MGTPKGAPTLRPEKLASLQVLRGVAALMVVVHHAGSGVDDFVAPIPRVALNVLDLGFLGVDLFFVLSGFIIAHAHFDNARGGSAAVEFFRKRVFRIFPAYLPLSLAMLALPLVAPGLSGGARNVSLASSLLLLPADGHPSLFVAWTLIHEMVFYAVFLSFFVSSRALITSMAVWAVLVISANALDSASGALRYIVGLLNLEFAVGVSAAWVVRRVGDAPGRWPFLLFGAAVMAAAIPWISHNNAQEWSRVVFSCGVAVVLSWMVAVDRKWSVRWPVWLMVVGNCACQSSAPEIEA